MSSLGFVWNIYHAISAFRKFTGGGGEEILRRGSVSCFLTDSDWRKPVETGWWQSQSTLCSMEWWTIGACAYLFSSVFTATPLRNSGFSGMDCAVLVRPLISAFTEVFDIHLHVGEWSCLPHGPGGSLPSGDAVSNRVGLAHPVMSRWRFMITAATPGCLLSLSVILSILFS